MLDDLNYLVIHAIWLQHLVCWEHHWALGSVHLHDVGVGKYDVRCFPDYKRVLVFAD